MNKQPATGSKNLIVVLGPTASGKTKKAIELALALGTEIISADSRQCYREMNIGVARPSPEELQLVKHHFIASHSIREEVNAAVFEKYALEKISEIFKKKDNVVMVGGTGLYSKAVCEGLDEIPGSDPAIRSSIIRQYEQKGLEWLQQELKEKDPLFFAEGEMQNPQRMMRALEVLYITGTSIRSFQKGVKIVRPFTISKIGLDMPRGQLFDRINLRVDQMMDAGLLQEAKSLFEEFGDLDSLPTALHTVGYTELFSFFRGQCSLPEAIAQIKQHTRHYAKRQMTWFRKDPAIQWISPAGCHPPGEKKFTEK